MRRILVVDDEESTRDLLSLTLQSDGYEVLCAEDGFCALGLCHTHPPDIVLTDIKMPGMDGIELLRRLKHINPDMEVIMITGHGQMGARHPGAAAGGVGFHQQADQRKGLERGAAARRAEDLDEGKTSGIHGKLGVHAQTGNG